MQGSAQLGRTFDALRLRLKHVNDAWTVDNYEALLGFYVRTVPRILDAERCGLFILDPASGRILSRAGTDLGAGDIEAPIEGSIVGQVVTTGEAVIDNALGTREGYHQTADAITGFDTRSVICVPIRSPAGGRVTGAVEVLNKRGAQGFSSADAEAVQEIADYLAMVLENILLNEEIVRLSGRLDLEVSHLRSAYLGDVPFVAESEGMRAVLELVRLVSATAVSVLIQVENATGKEVIARMIHEGGARADSPFVPVNCAAIPETLVESEFFGYEKGAFTGAASSRAGRFEEADGGTLFLDEVGDMPAAMQPKLLRALQEGEGTRLGGGRSVRYDLRVVSASNRRLADRVSAGEFREDLYYRLFAVEIVVPPLRERRDDIAPLAFAFLEEVCRRYQKSVHGLSGELVALFESYDWPGNVRQLRREIERLVALTPAGQQLTPERCGEELRALAGAGAASVAAGNTLDLPARVRALEIDLIGHALECTDGHKGHAAELLGITRQGLHKKLRRYGLISTPPP